MNMFYNVQKLLLPQSWVSMTARNSPWRRKGDKPSVASSLHSVRTVTQTNSEDHYYGAIYDGYGRLFRMIINSWLIKYWKSSLFLNCLHIFYQEIKINIFLKADFEILQMIVVLVQSILIIKIKLKEIRNMWKKIKQWLHFKYWKEN